jgi:L-lysine 2,3-aminomutase
MKADVLAAYLEPLLAADLPGLDTLRIGTKALTFWPHRFLTDPDADDLLRLFERVVRSGRQLALMAHFNHPAEVEAPAVRRAVDRIRATGARIRTQAPLLAGINDRPEAWARMWRKQVGMGMTPYYMFLARDTGARDYFAVPLRRAWRIHRDACAGVSGLARTARGPSMSAAPGKVQVLGEARVAGERVFVLNLLQARDPAWTGRPFFARFDPGAVWLDDLRPAFGERRFFFDEPAGEDPEAALAAPRRKGDGPPLGTA